MEYNSKHKMKLLNEFIDDEIDIKNLKVFFKLLKKDKKLLDDFLYQLEIKYYTEYYYNQIEPSTEFLNGLLAKID